MRALARLLRRRRHARRAQVRPAPVDNAVTVALYDGGWFAQQLAETTESGSPWFASFADYRDVESDRVPGYSWPHLAQQMVWGGASWPPASRPWDDWPGEPL